MGAERQGRGPNNKTIAYELTTQRIKMFINLTHNESFINIKEHSSTQFRYSTRRWVQVVTPHTNFRVVVVTPSKRGCYNNKRGGAESYGSALEFKRLGGETTRE